MGSMGSVEISGLTIAYERAGSGLPLVLLHSGLSDHREWRNQIDALADTYTVVAWDAPGCGASADPPDSFTLADYADCVVRLAAALRLERPHVAGLSFGGGLAIEVYHRAPDLARSLVLASAYAGWGGSLPADVVSARLAQVLEGADRPAEDLVVEWVPELLDEGAPAAAALLLTEILLDVRPTGTRAMARAFAGADLRPVLATVTVPTLLLYGEADERAGPPVARQLHSALPTSTLVTLPGVGHQGNLTAPDAFTREVRAFLARC